MLKKISLCLLGVGMTFGAYVASAQGISITLRLEPNDTQSFTAPSGTQGTCRVETPDASDKVHIKLAVGSGKINGTTYRTGQSVDLDVVNNQTFSVESLTISTVELTNQGASTIRTTCTSE